MTGTPAWIHAISASWLAHLINHSTWMFAAIEAGHLLGIVLFGGLLLAVDLSVLGVGFQPRAVHSLESQVRSWMIAGLCLIVLTGLLMFVAEAEKCYFNPAFQFKMLVFILAALTLGTLRRGAFRRINDQVTRFPAALKTISALSVTLWLGVAAGGRAIGFY